MHKPIIPITLAYLSGIVLGYGFLYLPYTTGALVILLIATAGMFTRRKKMTQPRVLRIPRVAEPAGRI